MRMQGLMKIKALQEWQKGNDMAALNTDPTAAAREAFNKEIRICRVCE